MIPDDTLAGFERLFRGRTDAYGTGRGGVIRNHLVREHYRGHLEGRPPGLGVFPLHDDGTVDFAAIDLDEPDFTAAMEMQAYLPGETWVERSRSGNAHVWAFFNAPVEAWVPRGIMHQAAEAAGKARVEVFPKQDRLGPGMLGNYINLPYHANARPVLRMEYAPMTATPMPVAEFVEAAQEGNYPDTWRTRAEWLGIESPEARERTAAQGERGTLHECALYIWEHRVDNPVRAGHRSVVYFSLAKQFLNWEQATVEWAWEKLCEVEAESPDRVPERELRRIFQNAQRGFTSTGCDDPLMAPYVRPDCPIARNG